MKWKELREVGRLTILTDKVLRQWVPQIVEIFEWWEVKTKTKRVGYFKWWVTEIEWWVMKKYKSKQGLSVLVRVWWDGCLDFFFFFFKYIYILPLPLFFFLIKCADAFADGLLVEFPLPTWWAGEQGNCCCRAVIGWSVTKYTLW